jgi:TrmH family RNA methyltransferase
MSASGARGHDALQGVVVVLFETQDYVNIAATVRAMKNFGLSRLRLVSPAEWDPWRIEGIAHDTGEIVAATEEFDSLEDAIADCTLVAAMTARQRRAKRTVSRPRDVAPEMLTHAAAGGTVAILLGREDHGLANAQLDRANQLVVIPTNPDHSSLNLAQAVLVMAYELWMAAEGGKQKLKPPRRDLPPATAREYETLFEAAEKALWRIDFFKSRKPTSVLRTLRELAYRASLDRREAAFLRAMAIEVVKYLGRVEADAGGGRRTDQNPPRH